MMNKGNKRRLISIISIIFMVVFFKNTSVNAATITIGNDYKSNFVNSQFYILGNEKVPTRTSITGKDNGYIYANDLCKVKNTKDSTYWQVEYPIANGTKTAYVKKSYILSNTNYSKSIKISANETVYRKSDMKTKFGTVYKTDNIILLSPVSNGKAQIMYNVSNGYKIGWIYVDGGASVKLNKTSITLKKGKTESLVATLTSSNESNKSIVWSSSNTKVATVDSKGKVTAVAEGTATITAKVAESGKTATCKVTVQGSSIAVTSIKLNTTTANLERDKTLSLTATVNPSNATNKNVTWKSSNTKVATVDSNGKVKGIAKGSATITVTTKDGSKTATCKVTVKDPAIIKVTSVKLNKTSQTIEKGSTVSLTATVNPSNATNKNVTWKSSNTKVATVDSNGKVKGIAKGSATITVTTKDGSKTATCKIEVLQSVEQAIKDGTLRYTGIEYTVDNIKYKAYYEPGKNNNSYAKKTSSVVFVKNGNKIVTDKEINTKLQFLRNINEDFDGLKYTRNMYKDIISTFYRIEASYGKINFGISLINTLLVTKNPQTIIASNAKYVKDKLLNADTYILGYNLMALNDKIEELDKLIELRKKGEIRNYSKLNSYWSNNPSSKLKSIHKNYSIIFKNITDNSTPFDVILKIFKTSKSTFVSKKKADQILNLAKEVNNASKLDSLEDLVNQVIDTIELPSDYLMSSPLYSIENHVGYSNKIVVKYKN